MTEVSNSRQAVLVDRTPLRLEDICDVALQTRPLKISDNADYRAGFERDIAFLDSLLAEDGCIYGVTTGYGDSCSVDIPADLVTQLPEHLFTFHGCGMGAYFDAQQTRAILAARIVSLGQGYSGVRYELLQALQTLLDHDILPTIPQEGSVGASGDLTPLSYVAATLAGQRTVLYQGEQRDTADVFAELGIQPLTLRPKEGLAIMNGTAVMTALACLAYQRAEYLCKIATRITSYASIALQGNDHHFDERLFAVKPHPGQGRIAAWLRTDLVTGEAPRQNPRLQDRYSLRCAPHVIGVLQDALPMLRQFIENELNSANDNPIIDGEGEHVLHGGHFYGGHIAFAMDSLKTAVANIADLIDRQMAQLMDTKFNHGLPPNLTGSSAERIMINHGFKAVQIGASAWTAEALKLTMPASVFSRSTECHNQDKVSMGTIAARDCLRVLDLTEQVCAAGLLAAVQGVDLRDRIETLPAMSTHMQAMRTALREQVPFLEEDRALEHELRATKLRIATQAWPLYAGA